MATIVQQGQMSAPEFGGLFDGLTFFVSGRTPQRSGFMNDIRANGGTIVKNEKPDTIAIVDHLREGSDGNMKRYSYKFIEGSLRKGQLEDLADYEVGEKVKMAKPARSSKTGSVRQKNPFTLEDDLILLRTLTSRPLIPLKGNKIYENLAVRYPHHSKDGWRYRWVEFLSQLDPFEPRLWLERVEKQGRKMGLTLEKLDLRDQQQEYSSLPPRQGLQQQQPPTSIETPSKDTTPKVTTDKQTPEKPTVHGSSIQSIDLADMPSASRASSPQRGRPRHRLSSPAIAGSSRINAPMASASCAIAAPIMQSALGEPAPATSTFSPFSQRRTEYFEQRSCTNTPEQKNSKEKAPESLATPQQIHTVAQRTAPPQLCPITANSPMSAPRTEGSPQMPMPTAGKAVPPSAPQNSSPETSPIEQYHSRRRHTAPTHSAPPLPVQTTLQQQMPQNARKRKRAAPPISRNIEIPSTPEASPKSPPAKCHQLARVESPELGTPGFSPIQGSVFCSPSNRISADIDSDLVIPELQNDSHSDAEYDSTGEQLLAGMKSLAAKYRLMMGTVCEAIERTSGIKEKVELVLESFSKGEGLPDIEGVWTEEEDDIVMKGVDARVIRDIEAKRGDVGKRAQWLNTLKETEEG